MNTDKIELYCQNLSSDEAVMLINYLAKIDTWYVSAEPLNDNQGVADETMIDMVLSHAIGYNKLYANVKLMERVVDGELTTPEYLGIKFTLDFKLDPEEDHLEVHSDSHNSEYITHDEWDKFKAELVSSLNHHIEVLKFSKIQRLNPEDVDDTVESEESATDDNKEDTIESTETKAEEVKEETDDIQ